MFTGKTTELIRRLREAADAGRRVLAIKPALDDRYHPTSLATHDGVTLPGVTVAGLADLERALAGADADVIGLDEAHFFPAGLLDALTPSIRAGRRLVVAGLDRTSLNRPFGEMASLLIEADEVLKLAGECAVCGAPAPHTVRLFDSTEDIVVGGEGMFENRCRVHLADPPPGRPRGA